MKVAKSYENYDFDLTKAYEKSGRKYVLATYQCDRCVKGMYVTRVENGVPVPHPAYSGVCLKCKGTGILTKEIRVYEDKEFETREKAEKKRKERKEAVKMEDFAKTKAEWLDKNGFNQNETTFIYFPDDSFDVKEDLKDAGFQFSKDLLWHIANVSDEYSNKVVEVSFSKLGEIAAWGTGTFRPDCRDTVNAIVKELRPKVEYNSHWIGSEGDRLSDIPAEILAVREILTKYGFTQIVKFIDVEGNLYNWWTKTRLSFNKGDRVYLTGTVKKFDEYDGDKITTLTRCRLKER